MNWAWVRDRCYTLARGWDMQPSEFWTLTLHDFWAEFDMRVRQANRIKEISSRGAKPDISEDIERARKLHREKKARLARERAAASEATT